MGEMRISPLIAPVGGTIDVSAADGMKAGDTSRRAGVFDYGPGSNEPGGLTAVIDYSPAVHFKDLDAALLVGSGDSWTYGANWGDKTETSAPFSGRVEVVTDATAPSGKATRVNFQIGDGAGFSGAAFYNNWRSRLGAFTDMYIRTHFYYSSNWEQHPSNGTKLFYFGGGAGGSATEFYPMYRSGGGLQMRDQGGAGAGNTKGIWRSSSSPIPVGSWHEIEIRTLACSSDTTDDGRMFVYIDGTEIAIAPDGTDTNWDNNLVNGMPDAQPRDPNTWQWFGQGEDVTMKGMQYGTFWGGSGGSKTVNDYMQWGGLFVSGST